MRPLPFFFCHPPRAFDLDYKFARRSASSIGTDIFIRVIRTLYKYLIYNTHRDAPIYFSRSLTWQLHICYFALMNVCARIYTYIFNTALKTFTLLSLLFSISFGIKQKRALIFKYRHFPVSRREIRCKTERRKRRRWREEEGEDPSGGDGQRGCSTALCVRMQIPVRFAAGRHLFVTHSQPHTSAYSRGQYGP